MSDEVPKWLEQVGGCSECPDEGPELHYTIASTSYKTVAERDAARAGGSRTPLGDAMVDVMDDPDSWFQALTAQEWMTWRGRVRDALGLVEPGVTVKLEDVPTTMTFGPNGVVWSRADGGKVIAAELRRLAESDNIPWQVTSLEREPSCGDLREAVQEWLRKRADELDPDYGPCRSCGRTGEGIVCDQCEDDERQSP